MDGSVLEEKSSFKMLGLIFFSKLNWVSYIISVAKISSKKIEALSYSMKFPSCNSMPCTGCSDLHGVNPNFKNSFFLLRLLCITINLLYSHAWNTVMSGMVLPVATWNC